jgi:hypothetical protein
MVMVSGVPVGFALGRGDVRFHVDERNQTYDIASDALSQRASQSP